MIQKRCSLWLGHLMTCLDCMYMMWKPLLFKVKSLQVGKGFSSSFAEDYLFKRLSILIK